MSEIFNLILKQPILNIFVGLYDIIPDVGLVIFLITIIIKLLLYPLTKKSIIAQKSLTELQPKMEELKKKYKDDQQKLAQETMLLYKEHKVNPFGSCLPILVQIPVFFALYYVIREGLNGEAITGLYPFIPNPGTINPVSLGIFNLHTPSPVLAVLAGAAQFWQTKMMMRKPAPKAAGEAGKDENMMAMVNKQMLYIMPVMTVFIGLQFPGGLALYWFLSTLLTAVQQLVLFKKKSEDGIVEGEIVK